MDWVGQLILTYYPMMQTMFQGHQSCGSCKEGLKGIHYLKIVCAGLENCTRPLVFTSAPGCRASENFDISSKNFFFPMYANIFCDAGQVPISRYFKA